MRAATMVAILTGEGGVGAYCHIPFIFYLLLKILDFHAVGFLYTLPYAPCTLTLSKLTLTNLHILQLVILSVLLGLALSSPAAPGWSIW